MIRNSLTLLGLLLFSPLSISEPIEDVKLALSNISQHLESRKKPQDLNQAYLQANIDTLAQINREYSLNDVAKATILNAQLRATYEINHARKSMGQDYDVSQAQSLLDTLDSYEQQGVSGLRDGQYQAGHIAAHQLDNFPLAHRYWFSCAQASHAGCMNILASGFESGEFVVSIDREQAAYWHVRVVETGIDWNCAGIFSALRLAKLSAIGVDSGKTLEQWLATADDLTEEMTKAERNVNCSPDLGLVANYVLTGFDEKWRAAIESYEFDADHKWEAGRAAWLANFATAASINELMPALDIMANDLERCTAAEEFAFKVRNDRNELQQTFSYMSGLSPHECDSQNALVSRLIELAN